MTLVVAETIYHKILRIFPQQFSLAFAYGSGVLQQAGYKNKENAMIDLVMVVDDPVQWHKNNLEMNPSHYSMMMKRLGYKIVANYEEKLGAKIYYNTLIPFQDRLFKYGVISKTSAITDLLDWETLYVCGRLHKPTNILHLSCDNVKQAMKHNLQSAVHTALLMLPDIFTEKEFYYTIAGLSYLGDFRMWIGEDKNKVHNIVDSQVEQFRELYMPIVTPMNEFVEISTSKGQGEQDLSPTARLHHLNLLPKNLQATLIIEFNKDGKSRDMEEVLLSAAHDIDTVDALETAISRIVWSSSVSQSIKAIPAAGMWKSLQYSSKKLVKMVKGGKKVDVR